MKTYVLVTMLLMAGSLARTQPKPVAEGPNRMEITLERREGTKWRTVDPGLVFAQNDHVRFRLRTNFDGYLYVTNNGTSGKNTLLFPREETGSQNMVKAGREYLVPASDDTFFRIGGPAGHEVVYWMMTPLELGTEQKNHSGYIPLPPPPTNKKAPQNMTPRCDDTLLRARGACIDSSAGPKEIAKGERLPENLAGAAEAAPRDLIFMREQNKSVVSSPAPLKGPVIYEFHLAHR